MPTIEIMTLDPADIVIGDRQRIDLGDIDGFAEDIRALGFQINPGTVEKQTDGKWHLVTGRRRLAACVKLGWKFKCIDHGSLTPQLAQQIEWAEDVHRKDRNPVEKCIALYKLRDSLETETGRSWTLRELEKQTGLSKSAVGHMLEVAEALVIDPLDEELRKACTDSWFDAYKVLQTRALAQAQRELEVRRQRLAQQTSAQPSLPLPGGEAPLSVVQSLDKTAEPEKVRVYLQGINKDFADAQPDIDFMTGSKFAVIMHGNAGHLQFHNAVLNLRPTGYIVYWEDSDPLMPDSRWMPFPLIWNQIVTPETSPYPFAKNYKRGWVIAQKGTYDEPKTSVVAAMPEEDGRLPLAVLELSLSACPPGMAVLLTNNANVVAVAELGFVPMWFEADKAKFEAQCAALKAHYERNIPNVEVVIR